MKFRGFLKKGSIKRRSNELSISDPGSDDSWDLLGKDDNQVNVFLSPAPKPSEGLPTAGTASTFKEIEVSPAVKEAAPKKYVIDKLSASQTKIADKSNTANISMESQRSNKKKKKTLLPLTSTPFVRHKHIPAFEVSSIISSVDDSINERLSEKQAQNDSGTILVLNRKNSAADDTFNQLLNPGKSIKKKSFRELGVRPLKSLINQGDTTRQYGGGAVVGKAIRTLNPSCDSNEDSWETSITTATETGTTELKKTSNSPNKMTRKSQEPSSASQTGSKEKAVTKNNHPSDRTSLQDENKVQGTVYEGNHSSSKRISRRSQSDHTNKERTVPTASTPENAAPIETGEKSIKASDSRKSEHASKKRVSFFEAQCTNSEGNEKEEKSQETEVQTHQDEKQEGKPGTCTSKQDKKNIPTGHNISAQPHGLVNRNNIHTSNCNTKHLHTQETLNPTKSSGLQNKEVNMVCQSNFAVKIGSSVFTQSSCFGVSVKLNKNKSSENNEVKPSQITPACVTGTELDKASNETNVKELRTSTQMSPSQQNKPSEMESSSEEERILLRAQSLKLRENQINSSRNSNSLKITDSCQLGLKTRHNSSPFKSPLPLDHQDASEQLQPSKPNTSNKSDHLNETASSCDVFISRQPKDCQVENDELENFEENDELKNFEENFELEIISSSEEESATKNHPKQQSLNPENDNKLIQSHKSGNADQLVELKHLRKASRLSTKTKEIRRRRMEKVEETRRSLGNSSGSDSPSPRPVQKRMIRRGKNAPLSSARDIEDIEKCKKKLLVDNVDGEKSAHFEKSNAPTVEEILPVKSPVKETLDQSSERNSKQKTEKKNIAKETNKPKKPKGRNGIYIIKKNRSSFSENVYKDPVATEPVSSQEVLQVEEHENLEKTDVELDSENPLSQEDGYSSTKKNKNSSTDPPAHEDIESGLRCSHRSRKPPSMYWLSNRAYTNNGLTGSQKQAISQSQKQNGKKQSSLKGQKRKIDKKGKLDTVGSKKRVRQSEQNWTSPQADTSPQHSDVEDVLIHEACNVKETEEENATCMPLKVKTTELVWGCGMKGDVLSLGAAAKCEEQKTNTYNQVFYVLEGKINLQVGQDEKILTDGSVFIVPRGETYTIKNLGYSTAKLFVTCAV